MSITTLVEKQKAYFYSSKTRSLEARLRHLEALYRGIQRYEDEVFQALKADLNKSQLEAFSTEIGYVLKEISFVKKRLASWMKPRRVKNTVLFIGAKGKIVPEPYGVTLIVAPWNYPFQLAIAPLIGAIAAGNTAIVKPSELTPNVSRLLAKLLGELFEEEHIAVVEGDKDTSTELLEQPFDYIFFTGSVPVGKIVMEAAAKRLTPVTLELGGKSPCIVHEDAKLEVAAKRIVWGKFVNAGQTCVAPDYVYVHHKVKDEFLHYMKKAIHAQYGSNPLENKNYVRIVSERHFERLVSFLQDGNPVIGGETDSSKLLITPTLLDGVTWESPIMQDEIFGPILPILVYDDIEEVIKKINERPKALALYLFTESKEMEQKIVGRISYGGGCINDTVYHLASPFLPFGGVGESGIGNYHGEYSFKAFSHYKSVLYQSTALDLKFRYETKENALKIIRKLLK
ncbi:aldehyde dehydrogenase [Bacillus sp. 165]|uniref:aldehyde dehydrogenase n=1 Tax=Bacillus sp. 165 TaxID=1529117 RepID=UPI001AD9BC7A|nr:aldehyde dehydrogenase [Bacillus sp. 165]MBO9128490.1 aldehyde dehydrogenase [Bacillus sp. 165]